MTVIAALRWLFAGVGFGCAEAAAATAGTDGLWIFDVEAAAHQVINIIDAGTADVEEAGWIDQHTHAVLLVDFIAFLWRIKGHAVLHAATSAALNKDTQGVCIDHALLGHDAAQFFGC